MLPVIHVQVHPKPVPSHSDNSWVELADRISVPEYFGSNTCTEQCDPYVPAHFEYTCLDKRRVLLTTGEGVVLCVLFPNPRRLNDEQAVPTK